MKSNSEYIILPKDDFANLSVQEGILLLFLYQMAISDPEGVELEVGRKKKPVFVKRGQCFVSLNYLAESIDSLTVKQLRLALWKLQEKNLIEMNVGRNGTLITVCNYV